METIILSEMIKSEEYTANLTKKQLLSDVQYIERYGWRPYLMVQGINSTTVIFNRQKNPDLRQKS